MVSYLKCLGLDVFRIQNFRNMCINYVLYYLEYLWQVHVIKYINIFTSKPTE